MRKTLWVRCGNLASRVPGESVRHLPEWWHRKHGYTPLLAETFVDPERFEGTCCRGAASTETGATGGHRRAGRDYYQAGAGLKNLWLQALRPDAAVRLRGPAATLPRVCAGALPVAAMGVLPVKHAQAESLHDAFARVPDPRAGNRHHRLAPVPTRVALSILMGRQRPADFVRLAQQLNARQRKALGYCRPPGKKARVAPGRDVFCTLLGRVEPPALASVSNEWLQAQHGQLPPPSPSTARPTPTGSRKWSAWSRRKPAPPSRSPRCSPSKQSTKCPPPARCSKIPISPAPWSASVPATPTMRPPAPSSRPAASISSDSRTTPRRCAPPLRTRSKAKPPPFSPTTATTAAPNTAS